VGRSRRRWEAEDFPEFVSQLDIKDAWRKRETLRKRSREEPRSTRRERRSTFSDVNRDSRRWYNICAGLGADSVPLTMEVLLQRVQEIAVNLGVSGFSASAGFMRGGRSGTTSSISPDGDWASRRRLMWSRLSSGWQRFGNNSRPTIRSTYTVRTVRASSFVFLPRLPFVGQQTQGARKQNHEGQRSCDPGPGGQRYGVSRVFSGFDWKGGSSCLLQAPLSPLPSPSLLPTVYLDRRGSVRAVVQHRLCAGRSGQNAAALHPYRRQRGAHGKLNYPQVARFRCPRA